MARIVIWRGCESENQTNSHNKATRPNTSPPDQVSLLMFVNGGIFKIFRLSLNLYIFFWKKALHASLRKDYIY